MSGPSFCPTCAATGYGDSDKPASDAEHRTYSKRVMADDLAALAKGLGWRQFDFVGHDRGGRVGHRLMLDHAQTVRKGVFVDIAPTATMYARTDMAFASRYFWWFFLIQPEPFPEKLINFDPEYFLRHHIKGQLKIEGTLEENVFQEYLRSYCNPETIHAICEDYRAAATIDLADDKADADKRIEALAEDFSDKHHALFLGRGDQYPIALEGALKLKEISYIHAEAYAAGELKHGPLALIDADMPVIVVAPNNELLEKLKSNIEEVRARGGQLYVFADQDAGFVSSDNMHIIEMPHVEEVIAPIFYTVPLQLLAYHVALIKGTDVDQPRNLAKSVTVE